MSAASSTPAPVASSPLGGPGAPFDVAPWAGGPDPLPLVVHARGERSVEGLVAWIRAHHGALRSELARSGALLLRGFEVGDAPAFERVARAIDPDLGNEYLGTSPRNALTSHVFTASELPPFYPIPQHCEMSFTARPPRRLFFACLVEPAAGSGETPLCDFRKVLRDVDPAVRRRFEERGIRIVRNYGPPGARSALNPFQLKGWDETFGTTERAVVEATCAREGFEPTFAADGGLRLVSSQPVSRRHPETGEEAWHNHVTTFHASAPSEEYRHIWRLRPTLRHLALWQVSRALAAVQRRTKASDSLAMHCTHRDGGEIADADVAHVLDVIWRHLVIVPWRRGDVVAIDNYAVSHGRLPYAGPRRIAVCWA
ncbi:MAG TPA: TauD/TfdA family dioxygenase [Myxococcota bacterium]|jgi:alpha-ketoglutarate-dependent taurine dioxygenase|nr:TauD/TfdA family dioxygenase [Myxococcota bacterium]